MTHSNLEVEIKLKLTADLPQVRKQLRELGFAIARRRVFEVNVVFDTPAKELRGRRELLRIRRVGKTSTLTYKGPPLAGPHKSREEIETTVQNADQLDLIFSRLGFEPCFRYEKFRTEYRDKRGKGVVTVDETPIGNFLELEGPPNWIDSVAKRLGYQASDYITKSYGTLYQEYCRQHGLEPENMVFG